MINCQVCKVLKNNPDFTGSVCPACKSPLHDTQEQLQTGIRMLGSLGLMQSEHHKAYVLADKNRDYNAAAKLISTAKPTNIYIVPYGRMYTRRDHENYRHVKLMTEVDLANIYNINATQAAEIFDKFPLTVAGKVLFHFTFNQSETINSTVSSLPAVLQKHILKFPRPLSDLTMPADGVKSAFALDNRTILEEFLALKKLLELAAVE